MPDYFPELPTATQALVTHADEYRTRVLRYLDGSEQRIADSGSVIRRWSLRLEALSEGDARKVLTFYRLQAGRAGTFAFTDPVTGSAYSECWFESDEVRIRYVGEDVCAATLVIAART